mgnify:CR=1 FL=1
MIENSPDPLHQRFSEAFADIPEWEQAMIMAGLERIATLLDEDTPDPVTGPEVHELSTSLSFPAEPQTDMAKSTEEPTPLRPAAG